MNKELKKLNAKLTKLEKELEKKKKSQTKYDDLSKENTILAKGKTPTVKEQKTLVAINNRKLECLIADIKVTTCVLEIKENGGTDSSEKKIEEKRLELKEKLTILIVPKNGQKKQKKLYNEANEALEVLETMFSKHNEKAIVKPIKEEKSVEEKKPVEEEKPVEEVKPIKEEKPVEKEILLETIAVEDLPKKAIQKIRLLQEFVAKEESENAVKIDKAEALKNKTRALISNFEDFEKTDKEVKLYNKLTKLDFTLTELFDMKKILEDMEKIQPSLKDLELKIDLNELNTQNIKSETEKIRSEKTDPKKNNDKKEMLLKNIYEMFKIKLAFIEDELPKMNKSNSEKKNKLKTIKNLGYLIEEANKNNKIHPTAEGLVKDIKALSHNNSWLGGALKQIIENETINRPKEILAKIQTDINELHKKPSAQVAHTLKSDEAKFKKATRSIAEAISELKGGNGNADEYYSNAINKAQLTKLKDFYSDKFYTIGRRSDYRNPEEKTKADREERAHYLERVENVPAVRHDGYTVTKKEIDDFIKYTNNTKFEIELEKPIELIELIEPEKPKTFFGKILTWSKNLREMYAAKKGAEKAWEAKEDKPQKKSTFLGFGNSEYLNEKDKFIERAIHDETKSANVLNHLLINLADYVEPKNYDPISTGTKKDGKKSFQRYNSK